MLRAAGPRPGEEREEEGPGAQLWRGTWTLSPGPGRVHTAVLSPRAPGGRLPLLPKAPPHLLPLELLFGHFSLGVLVSVWRLNLVVHGNVWESAVFGDVSARLREFTTVDEVFRL